MNISIKNAMFFVVILIFFSTVATAAEQLSPKELETLMSQAMPDKPQVPPKQKRKVLICDLARGYKHDTAAGVKALTMLGEKTGAYKPVHSEDISFFEPDKIKQFDAIVLLSTSGELFSPAENLEGDELKAALERQEKLQKSFADYISAGGGLVGIHACTISFCDWPEFGEILGAYFSFHPTASKVWVKNEKPDNPINAGFMGEDFQILDEIYRFTDRDSEYCRFDKQPFSREKLRVLLRLDFSKEKKNARDRADGDAAISWIKPYGQGRVFYCGLGHYDEEYCNPMLLRHYLAGIQYATGDLEADDTPDKPTPAETTEEAVISLFNGKDLSGWDCDPRYWSVKDGAIVARVEEGTRVDNHTYAIWNGGSVKDFELRMKVRWTKGNSGIDYRAERIEKDRDGQPLKYTIQGYQADITDGWMCSLYNWNKPGAQPGQFVIVEGETAPRARTMELIDPNILRKEYFRPGGWNEFTIIARGSHIIERLNGFQSVEFIDNGPQARNEGLLGMQVHSGTRPQLFEFKDIRLREFDKNFAPAKLLFDGKIISMRMIDRQTPNSFKTVRTDESYGDFVLRFHYRKGDVLSAVCLRDEQPDGPGISIMGQRSDFNEFIDTSGSKGMSAPKHIEPKFAFRNVPEGFWNECEIRLEGKDLEVNVNGVLRMQEKVLKTTPGKIGFSGFGGEYRNIVLIPILN